VRTLEQQIRSTDFAVSRKGYNRPSVDEALDGFADEVARLLEQLRRESVRVSALERSLTFTQNGAALRQPDLASLMVEGSEMKVKLLDEARKQAAEIVETANRQASESTDGTHAVAEPADAHRREGQIEMALEEAAAIESAARDLADAIRRKAQSEADDVLASAHASARNPAEVDTGTGASGIEFAQQYG
jgi:cell division septum initiation protein DivIVA